MKVLVINAGSSSLKFQVIDMDNEEVIAKGICEEIGGKSGFKFKVADPKPHAASLTRFHHCHRYTSSLHRPRDSDK